MQNNDQKQIAGAIIVVGVLIAGAILLRGDGSTIVSPDGKKLSTNAKTFNECLDSGKYAGAVTASNNFGSIAGVNGTPKSFILRDDKIINTIDGAEPTTIVTQRIEQVLSGGGKVMADIKLEPISDSDFMIGEKGARVAIVEYADFQCPFCGKFFREIEPVILNYAKEGKVKFVYRDFAFLGTFVQPYVKANDESINAAQATRCAGEQGKFWEYHDYLYNHQNGENQGAFSNLYLKSFAGELKLK